MNRTAENQVAFYLLNSEKADIMMLMYHAICRYIDTDTTEIL